MNEDNPDVKVGLASIANKVDMAYGYKAGEGTAGWTVYDPAYPAKSDLTTLYKGRGYWINVSEACTLDYGGFTYDLDAGWNLIGWLGCKVGTKNMAIVSPTFAQTYLGTTLPDQLRTLGFELIPEWIGTTPSNVPPEETFFRDTTDITPEEFEKAISDSRVSLVALFGHAGSNVISQSYKEGDTRITWKIRSDLNNHRPPYYSIKKWLANRQPPGFSFLEGCYSGKNSTSPKHLCYEFRKGQNIGTAAVGFVNLPAHDFEPEDMQNWTKAFWGRVCEGKTFYQAFQEAGALYPEFADNTVFVGDKNINLESIKGGNHV